MRTLYKEEFSEYPEYVIRAVIWWAEVLKSNGRKLGFMDRLFGKKSEYTDAELMEFQEQLAQEILSEIRKNGKCVLDIGFGSPNTPLANAGKKINADFPHSHTMWIEPHDVHILTDRSSGIRRVYPASLI